MTLHDDLVKDRGLVLVRGDVEKELAKNEAEFLMDQTVQSTACCRGSRRRRGR